MIVWKYGCAEPTVENILESALQFPYFLNFYQSYSGRKDQSSLLSKENGLHHVLQHVNSLHVYIVNVFWQTWACACEHGYHMRTLPSQWKSLRSIVN